MYPSTISIRCARRRRGIAGLLFCLSATRLWAATPPGAGADLPPAVRSFATLAHGRPVFCDQQDSAPPAAWLVMPAQCAWRGRLVMHRWVADAPGVSSCLSAPANWWHWRAALAGATPWPIWKARWRRQGWAPPGEDGDGARRLVLLAQAGDGGWVATEWRWTPPERAATRAWEQQRWQDLRRDVLAASDAQEDAVASPLQELWRRHVRGRPAERVGPALVWQGEHQCLRLLEADQRDDPAMPLPFAREDSRLEQRAAIQVQLARAAPGATWPAPFHLMLPSVPQQRSATYAAIARRGQMLVGRLWLQGKTGQAPLRARLEVGLMAPAGSAAETRAVSLLDREMAALAALWTADHER
ncbi:hypothetical protein [Duganella rhizosphaerae]|uniref:hypothetical protein n=1 Tax=Duganella rhizosphaerae TaxID=2885763 RepID=UPI00403F8228